MASGNILQTFPELLLSIGALILLLVAGWRGDASTRGIGVVAVVLLGGAAVSLLGPAGHGGIAFDGLYKADAFAAYGKVLIYVAAAVCIVVAPRWFARGGVLRAEYPILILLSCAGMGMMVSAADLLTLYVGLELQSLAAYVLASFMRRDGRSAEAGLKYFILGALASGILLYGIALLYGFAGTTEFEGVRDQLAAHGLGTGLLFGLVFTIAGLAFKIAAVPFHMWTPDVYEGAPTPVTAFFASAPKVAAMALLMRVAVEMFGPATMAWRQIVIFSSLASIVLGAVAAIGQQNIKRLLAYSSINNIGFVLLGLAAGTPEGVSAMLVYMTVYIAMTLGSFLCIMRMRDWDGAPVEEISALAGLSRSRPWFAAALAMFMLSLAGIPPLFGFEAKRAVFAAATDAGLFWLAAAGAVGSVIGAYYYLRVVKVMYFDDPAPGPGLAASTDRVEGGLIAVAAVAISPVGYLAIPFLYAATAAAAKALFQA